MKINSLIIMEDYQQKDFRFVVKYNEKGTLSCIDSRCLFAFFYLIEIERKSEMKKKVGLIAVIVLFLLLAANANFVGENGTGVNYGLFTLVPPVVAIVLAFNERSIAVTVIVLFPTDLAVYFPV